MYTCMDMYMYIHTEHRYYMYKTLCTEHDHKAGYQQFLCITGQYTDKLDCHHTVRVFKVTCTVYTLYSTATHIAHTICTFPCTLQGNVKMVSINLGHNQTSACILQPYMYSTWHTFILNNFEPPFLTAPSTNENSFSLQVETYTQLNHLHTQHNNYNLNHQYIAGHLKLGVRLKCMGKTVYITVSSICLPDGSSVLLISRVSNNIEFRSPELQLSLPVDNG